MSTHRVTLNLLQDAAIGDSRAGGQMRTSRDHVPGWVLRGALAAAWIRGNGVPDLANPRRSEFVALFESGDGVRFNPLYRSGAPVGLSVLEHKRGRGCGASFDAIDFGPGGAPHECDRGDCRTTLEYAKGATPKSSGTVRRDFTSALAADETPKDSHLYGRESLDHRAVPELAGFIGVRADLLSVLTELGERLVIGGAGSTRGLAELKIADEPSTGGGERVSLQPGTAGEPANLVIRLASPGIFVDSLGRPTRLPDPQELREALGVGVVSEDSGPKIRAWVRWAAEGGWHAASGLPKPTERAVAAGSTYVVTLTEVPDQSAIRSLAERGLGLRRSEGFGSLMADSAHVSRAPAVAAMFGAGQVLGSARVRGTVLDRTRSLARARSVNPDASAPSYFTTPPDRYPTTMKEFFKEIADLNSDELLELVELLEAR